MSVATVQFVRKARMQSLVLVKSLQANCICMYCGGLPVFVVIRDKLPTQVQYFAFKIPLFCKDNARSE